MREPHRGGQALPRVTMKATWPGGTIPAGGVGGFALTLLAGEPTIAARQATGCPAGWRPVGLAGHRPPRPPTVSETVRVGYLIQAGMRLISTSGEASHSPM
jgi:hypothetical protein